jgi:uncharacterized protein (TIGR03382 family)
MSEINAIVHDPFVFLLSPVWFLFLAAGLLAGIVFRRRGVWILSVTLAVITAWYRENLIYVFLRLAISRMQEAGQLSKEYAAGSRVVVEYCQATSLYAAGITTAVGLSAVLFLLRRRGQAS